MRGAVVLLLLLCACGEERPGIEVTVAGRTADIWTLEVSVRAAQVGSVWPSQTVSGRQDQFVIRLPRGLSGDVDLRVRGLREDGCQVAEGARRVRLQPELSVVVRLRRLAALPCGLHVALQGDGAGAVTGGPDLRCGPVCATVLPPGREMTLHAEPAQGSFFAGWSGACWGTGACQVRGGNQPVKVAAAFVSSDPCTPEGWCWQNPLPHGRDINGIFGFSARDIWAVGNRGLVLRWNGSFWVPMKAVTREDLYGIWGSGPDDIWATGDNGAMVHFDGAAWRAADPFTTKGVPSIWGSGLDDVWAVNRVGAIYHFDGQAWDLAARVPDAFLRRIWGTGPADVWAVGDLGALLRYDGRSWARVQSGTTRDLYALWGSGPDDVWATGENATVLHWDGASWRSRSISSLPGRTLFVLWGTARDNLWAGGESPFVRWDGMSWSVVWNPISAAVLGLWGSSDSDVWAVGDAGMMQHWNGFHWVSHSSGPRHFLMDGWASSPTDVWAVGDGPILHGQGRVWRVASDITDMRGIWGTGPRDIWAVGGGGRIVHFDGERWTDVPSGTERTLQRVWGSGPHDIWAVGDEGTVVHHDGAAWRRVDSATRVGLRGVWGSGPRDVWVVGEKGTILRWDGSRLVLVPVPLVADVDCTGVWGSGPDDVWVLGSLRAGLRFASGIVRYDGKRWWLAPVGSADLESIVTGIWGSGPDDAWVVSEGGEILHWDGRSVSRTERMGSLLAVWGRGRDVWAAGFGGVIVHRSR